MSNDTNELELDFHEVMDLMEQTTKNLQRIRETMQRNRWQFGGMDRPELANLAKECEDALNGWMSSVC